MTTLDRTIIVQGHRLYFLLTIHKEMNFFKGPSQVFSQQVGDQVVMVAGVSWHGPGFNTQYGNANFSIFSIKFLNAKIST